MEIPSLIFCRRTTGWHTGLRHTRFVEVGNTEDIDKIADILRELGDHYLEEDVASIPLSLTAYMKVTSFNPVVYEVCYMDKERKQRTVEEEKLRKEAVQELLIYQG